MFPQPISPAIVNSQTHGNHGDCEHESSINPIPTPVARLSLSGWVDPYTYDEARTTAYGEIEGDGKARSSGRMSI